MPLRIDRSSKLDRTLDIRRTQLHRQLPVGSTVAVDPMPMTVLLSGIVSTIASILLLAEFLAIVNPLGAASCVGWVVTFVLFIYWNVFDAFPVYGPDKIGLIGPLTKLVAACFFNIQPWSYLIAPYTGEVHGDPLASVCRGRTLSASSSSTSATASMRSISTSCLLRRTATASRVATGFHSPFGPSARPHGSS